SAASLAGVPRGVPMGIAGAPQTLPPAARLLSGAWTVCSAQFTDASNAVSSTESVLYVGQRLSGGTAVAADSGVLAQTPSGAMYLLWHATAYPIPNPANVRKALSWSSEQPVVISPALVNTLAAGENLAPTPNPHLG